jgi:hypothetical protein
MPGVLIGLILLLTASIFAAVRSRAADSSTDPFSEKGITVRKMLGMSRDDVETLLESVDRKELPEPVMGAMCYEPVAAPSVSEYICPVCGERTLYDDDYTTILRVEDLFMTRALFDSLQVVADLDLMLDETSFCSNCGFGDAEPSPVLIVDFTDAEPCSSMVSNDDLRLLIGFFSGETSYTTANDGSLPVKPELDRIRMLLGISEDE